MVIDQFAADIEIWRHQRYTDPPALSTAEYDGFTAFRDWAAQFYPDAPAAAATDCSRTSLRRTTVPAK